MALELIVTNESGTHSILSSAAESSVDFIVKDNQGGQISYEAAVDFAKKNIPRSKGGLSLSEFQIEKVNQSVSKAYEISADYVLVQSESTISELDSNRISRQDLEPFMSNYQSSSESQHVTQSLETVDAVPIIGNVAPNYKGGIGFDGERFEGVDYLVPVTVFTIERLMFTSDINIAFRNKLDSLTDKINSDQFLEYKPKEVLCLGSNFQVTRGERLARVTHDFKMSKQKVIKIGDAEIKKEGWDYFWTLYQKKVENNFLVKTPRAMYTERIYEKAQFSLALGVL